MSALNDRFARLAALKPARRTLAPLAEEARRGVSVDLPAGSERLAQLLGAVPQQTRFGEHLGLRRWFSESIGPEAPDGPLDLEALRLVAPGAPAVVADPQQWLFLDTETTGIVGGTGTVAFLVGIAWWDAGGLEVEQFFLREHSEEHSLLTALAERLAERRVLVTFNGKTFDWPLLETRYRMTRSIRVPEPRTHLDFLHPSRNLWRLRLGSVRLPELERHVLGWNRGVDVMSEYIPQIYFDFLRGGAPDPLVPIFLHNQMDLRGLAGLAARVMQVLSDPEKHGCDAFELYGASRICERRGESKRARKLYERTIAQDAAESDELPEQASRVARRALALMAKREGDHSAAIAHWEQLLGTSREGIEAYEQLAIYHERQARDLRHAVDLVREALAELRRAQRAGLIAQHVHARARARFERRLARLERKLDRESSLRSRELLAPNLPSSALS
ncbi:MAG TPA: ribonuclease H-like domain-containing protein [Candidatus Aquilonibacter sp.]|nr:ribonuclease H-like domain-containing protein [Candidatus Aquilonibacter sp.]